MQRTYDGIVNDDGTIRLLEPVELSPGTRVLVTVLDVDDDEDTINGVPVAALLAQPALAEYWDRPEEDEAWRHFQDADPAEEK